MSQTLMRVVSCWLFVPNEVVMAKNYAEEIVRDFLESSRLDRMAEYVQRGRKYAPLSDEDLIAKWLAGVKAMADAPEDPACYAEQNDTESELALRKLDPPHDLAQPDVDRYVETSEAAIRAIESDPERLAELRAGIVEDLRAFQEGRERSN
jgi:hypothetical protein